MAAKALSATNLINDANLISYYPLDTDSNDTKGNCNLTDTSVVYQSSPAMFTKSANYNGSSSKSHGTRTTGLSGSFTVMGWMFITDKTQENAFFESGVASYTNYWAYGNQGIPGGNARLQFNLYDGTNNPNISGNTNLFNSTWHQFAFVRNTGTGKIQLYLDGSTDATDVTDTTSSVPTYSDFDIGARNKGSAAWFKGNLDDISVFSRALSSSEISGYYNGTLPGPGSSSSMLTFFSEKYKEGFKKLKKKAGLYIPDSDLFIPKPMILVQRINFALK